MPCLACPRAGRLGALALGLLSLATPQVAAAQWVPLPGDQWTYEFQYSTTGTFSCGILLYMPGTTCTPSGSSVVFVTGERSVTMTYHGVSSPVRVALDEAPRVSLGEVEVRFAGLEPYRFPPALTASAIVGLSIGVAVDGLPTPGGRGPALVSYRGYPTSYGWGSPPSEFIDFGTYGYLVLGSTTYPPTGNSYGLVLSQLSSERMPAANGRIGFEATVSLAPEPGTWALMGTGLVAIGGIAARRRRDA